MQITLKCTQCAKMLRVAETAAGKSIRCPACQTVLTVPKLVQATPVVAKPIAPPPSPAPPDPFADLGTLPQPSAYAPYPTQPTSFTAPATARRKKGPGGGSGLKYLGIALGGFVGLLLLGGLAVVAIGFIGSQVPVASLTPTGISVPTFPNLGAPFAELPGGVKVYFVSIANGSAPGASMQFRVYMPAGTHADASLPCVLVAPAGTNLLHGSKLDTGNYHDEAFPYAQAGMAVITYSIDGDFPEAESSDEQKIALGLRRAYNQFAAAKAGVVNGRNALEFALQKLPQVDPKRIYCAGHSSAGTLSLLLAAHESRIAAGIAYAPATDLTIRLADAAAEPSIRRLLPNLTTYLKNGSPVTHVNRYKSPLFVFHARDDSNEPFSTTQAFVTKLQAASVKVTFVPAARGDHYQSMIDEGIPQAIRWIQRLP